SPVPAEFDSFGKHQRLELRFHDVIEDVPDMVAPRTEDIRSLLAPGQQLTTSQSAELHLLIHCHAGFSRSPAALVLLLAQARPSLPAEALASEILRIRPNVWPNLRVIELGGRMLHRRGDLVEAASWIYRYRLEQDPGLADMIIANGRAREVDAGRTRKGMPPLNRSTAALLRT